MATFAEAHESDPAYHKATVRILRLLFTEYRMNRKLLSGMLLARVGGATSSLLAKVASGILPYVDTEELFGEAGLSDEELFERYEGVFPEMSDDATVQRLDAAVDSLLAEKEALSQERDYVTEQLANKFMSRIG